jgi:SAM-dependent MidA family methyltransferase
MVDRPSSTKPKSTETEESGRVARAVKRLAEVADPDGFVPFDRFMEVALYDPVAGFYARERPPFGRSGDYYTAAHVHPLFGRTLGERIRAVRRALGPERPFRVVEVGPGDGTLAETILSALGGAPESAVGVEYLLVERSASLRQVALERVEAAGRSAGIPVRLADSLSADGPFEGVVLANEVLDAQPTRRLEWTGAEWRELGVRVVDGGVGAASAPLRTPVPAPELPSPDEPGTVLEVSPAAEGWVREVSDHLARGLAVILDYGMEEAELLAGHRFGTLAAVRRHRAVDDPLSDPGSTDLSMFVNFSRIRTAAKRAGLEEVALRSQADALGAWGFPSLFGAEVRAAGSAEAEVRLRLAAKSLLFGFDRFRVLELSAPNGAAELRAVR